MAIIGVLLEKWGAFGKVKGGVWQVGEIRFFYLIRCISIALRIFVVKSN